jgi:hypothetical protein
MSYVELYWLPLGAGGHVVRLNGRLYEQLVARRDHRRPADLYHSALEVRLGGDRYVIEMAPVWSERSPERGVVLEGVVGSSSLGRFRLFRYEIRCWRGGRIPDVGEAVDSPRRLSSEASVAHAVLELVPQVPVPVWGRDQLRTGEMWNSNSVISWLLTRAGIGIADIAAPSGGRAPGWAAGIAVARSAARVLRDGDRAGRAAADLDVLHDVLEQGEEGASAAWAVDEQRGRAAGRAARSMRAGARVGAPGGCQRRARADPTRGDLE